MFFHLCTFLIPEFALPGMELLQEMEFVPNTYTKAMKSLFLFVVTWRKEVYTCKSTHLYKNNAVSLAFPFCSALVTWQTLFCPSKPDLGIIFPVKSSLTIS